MYHKWSFVCTVVDIFRACVLPSVDKLLTGHIGHIFVSGEKEIYFNGHQKMSHFSNNTACICFQNSEPSTFTANLVFSEPTVDNFLPGHFDQIFIRREIRQICFDWAPVSLLIIHHSFVFESSKLATLSINFFYPK